MPDTGTGTEVYAANETAGTQVSSDYEGQHLTFLASELTTKAGAGVVVKGEPVVVKASGGDIVGVAFNSGSGSDLIAIDTEGIWNLLVAGEGDEGNLAVAVGDALYINDEDGDLEISRKIDPEQNTLFGYALGGVTLNEASIIAVKVHWGPSEDHIFMGKSTNAGAHYTTDATGEPRVEINSDYTATTGAHDVIKASMTFLPAANSGTGWHNTVNFNMILGEGDTFTGAQGKLCGVAAGITFLNGAVVDEASSIFCALRGTIRSTGTPVFTAFESLTGLMIDVVGAIDMSGKDGAFNSSGIYFMNPSGTAFVDSCMHIYGGAWDNLFNLDGANRGGNEGIMHTSGAYDGGHVEASVLVDGVEHRIRIYKAS